MSSIREPDFERRESGTFALAAPYATAAIQQPCTVKNRRGTVAPGAAGPTTTVEF
jgi:hypothetical protein